MSEATTEYLHTDDEGDTIRIRYTRRTCCCAGNSCYPDTLEVEDSPGAGEFFGLDIECSEIKWFIEELLGKSLQPVK